MRPLPSCLLFTMALLVATPSVVSFFAIRNPASTTTRLSTRRYNFFKDMISQAFENDSSLSQEDKLKGMLEGPGDEDVSNNQRRQLTATQEAWRAKMQGGTTPASLENTSIEMDFYLTGVPDKDPSSNLYSQKENISSRDRKVGLTLPKEPTLTGIRVEFLPGDKCQCTSDNSFTLTDMQGDWRVSEDGKQVRFRIPVSGYSRTVLTKGSIQKIYWSNQEEQTTQTSTTYSIPAGWLYGEAELTTNAKGELQWNDGVLKVEKAAGLLGAATTMVACGKFTVQPGL